MFDSRIRPLIDPITDAIGRGVSRVGITANMMTIIGGVMGVGAFIAISQSAYMAGLVLILLNRLADGLDGAVARHQGASDFGGFIDIIFDFIFYALVPLGFALADPGNAVAACFLVVSFIGTGSSFLAFAIMAEKRGLSTAIRGHKSLYYLGGLTEGAETIAVLVLMCLMPHWFIPLAWGFGALCWLTTASRVWWGWESFGKNNEEKNTEDTE